LFGCLLCFSSGARSSHDGKTVRPDRYRGLTAFASLSMAVSDGKMLLLEDTGADAKYGSFA